MKSSIEDVKQFLKDTIIPMRLSYTSDSGWPGILSLWYLYQDKKIYCATQESSRIVAHLRRNPQCAFEIAADNPPYCGVRGQAIAEINKGLGVEILEKLLQRYLGGVDNTLAQDLLSKKEQEVAIVLDPVNIFKWNFSNRMQYVTSDKDRQKLCP